MYNEHGNNAIHIGWLDFGFSFQKICGILAQQAEANDLKSF